jgi:hypothetical protein
MVSKYLIMEAENRVEIRILGLEIKKLELEIESKRLGIEDKKLEIELVKLRNNNTWSHTDNDIYASGNSVDDNIGDNYDVSGGIVTNEGTSAVETIYDYDDSAGWDVLEDEIQETVNGAHRLKNKETSKWIENNPPMFKEDSVEYYGRYKEANPGQFHPDNTFCNLVRDQGYKLHRVNGRRLWTKMN